MDEVLRALYAAREPQEPLDADDTVRYVDCGEVRGSRHLLRNLALRVQSGQSESTQLLSGHRGCGKTTELRRLAKQVGTTHFPVYLDAAPAFDLNDVDAHDVLLGIGAAVWDQVGARTGSPLGAAGIQGIYEQLKEVLSLSGQVGLSIPLPAIFATLNATLKHDSQRRSQLRNYLATRPTTLLDSVNEVIHQAAGRVAETGGYRGLFVIVDSLDRLGSRKPRNEASTIAENLFVDSWELLAGLECHMLYTIPPSVANSPRGGNLRPERIRMIPPRTRAGEPNEAGIAKLEEILERRAASIGLARGDAFHDDAARLLAEMSGGFERQLLVLVQYALADIDKPPVTREAADYAARQVRDRLADGLVFQHQRWETLRAAARTRPSGLASTDLDLLDNHYLLDYTDGDGHWYDVNPVLTLAHAFQP